MGACGKVYLSPAPMCLRSKAIILIFIWMLLISVVLNATLISAQFTIFLTLGRDPNTFVNSVILNAFFAFVTVCYPIGGFIADGELDVHVGWSSLLYNWRHTCG